MVGSGLKTPYMHTEITPRVTVRIWDIAALKNWDILHKNMNFHITSKNRKI